MNIIRSVFRALSALLPLLTTAAWLAGVFFLAVKFADNGMSTWLAIAAGFGIMVAVALVLGVVFSIAGAVVESLSMPPEPKKRSGALRWNGSAFELPEDPEDGEASAKDEAPEA